ncbi:hypothetical protein SALBM311S_04388 [Streptomyces alboniger]
MPSNLIGASLAPTSTIPVETIVAPLVDCHIPGLGVEIYPFPVQRADLNGDGANDFIVQYMCYTGDSSAPTQLEVFSGETSDRDPKSIGRVVSASQWVTVRRIHFEGSRLTVMGAIRRDSDAIACPSILYLPNRILDSTKMQLSKARTMQIAGCA